MNKNDNNITQLGLNIPINIKTLTPLHIGGNTVLSPLADYVMDAQKNICIIDSMKLAEAVTITNNTDAYIREVQAVVTEKKGRMLPDFARNKLKKEIETLTTGDVIKSYGIANPIDIDCCIKTDGLAYLPGSSLKGALRNAILQNWLGSGSTESDRALNDFLTALKVFAKRDDLKKNRKKNEIENAFREKMEEKLFGNLKQSERLAASCLRVPDTGTVALESLSVYQLERFHLINDENKERNILVLKECISNDIQFKTTISIDYYNIVGDKIFHKVFKDIVSKLQLFILLNNNSLDLIKYEIAVLDNRDVLAGKLKMYREKLEEIKEKIEISENRKAYMRLGFGKMQFYQTIALSIFKKLGSDENNDDWVQYLCYCNDLSEEISAVYPVTRVLTTSGLKPLGWIELS